MYKRQCLPFTSIIDQNATILEEIFKKYTTNVNNDLNNNWIAKHHYLSSYNDCYDNTKLEDSEAEYLTVGWEQEVIVTTFVQFLESIFTNQNKSLRKFHNICNSIIVLDEVQNIPAKYFEVIEVVFRKLSSYFGTKFIFVTATQPFLFADNDHIVELTDPDYKKTHYYFCLLYTSPSPRD